MAGILTIVFTVYACGRNSKETQQSQESSNLNNAKQIDILPVKESEYDLQNYWGTITHNFAKGDGGYYYTDNHGNYLMFFDETEQTSYPLCGLPDCSHNSSDCNAYIGMQKGVGYLTETVYYYKGYLYLLNSEGDLVRFSPDGSQRQKIATVYNYGQGDTGTNLVFHDDSVYVYNINQHLGMEEEYTETITRYSLDGKQHSVIVEYTGSGSAIMQAKCYGDQLFFIVSGVSKQNVNEKVVLSQTYKGLYVYRTDTKESGKVIDEEVTGYCIDEKNNLLYYFVKQKGLYCYDINAKEQKLLLEADENNQMPELSFDGQYIYMDNSTWATFEKRVGKEIEKQCFVVDEQGNIVYTISCANTNRIYFGDRSYLFANTAGQKKDSEKSEYSYLKKSELAAGEWIPMN